MTHALRRIGEMRRTATFLVVLVSMLGATVAWPAAQQAPAPAAKKALGIDDYTKWRSITSSSISGDGKWVAYGVQFSNTSAAESKPVQHLLNLGTNENIAIPQGTGGSFSADSRWFAYSIEPPGRGGGRGARGGGNAPGGTPGAPPAVQTPPPAPPATPPATPPTTPQEGRGAATPPAEPRRVELRNLATGAIKSWQDIQSFTFSNDSTHLLLRRRAPQGAGGGGARAGGEPPAGGGAAAATPDAATAPRGVDVIVHSLITGRDRPIGSVADVAFNRAGDLLAYTVDATVKDGNGLFVMDVKTGRTTPIDNDAKRYTRLTWSEDGTALAVLKGTDVERMRERDNVLFIVTNVRAAADESPEPGLVVLDPAKTDGFPKNWVVSDRTTLDWSDDKRRVFFGIKPQVPAPRPARQGGAGAAEEVANVDVWNTRDERIQSLQMARAEAERNFTFRQAFDVGAGKFIRLTDETMRDLDVAPDGTWAVGRDTRGYVHDFKRPAADLYRVNTATGERTLILKNHITSGGIAGFSPDGRHFLLWKDSKYHAYDLAAASLRPIGSAAVNFTDMEFDRPGPKPAYGIAGYTSDGKSVIAQHRFDLWQVPLDGSAPANLTAGLGQKHEVRYRYVRTEPVDPLAPPAGGRGGGAGRQTIDLSKPVTLSTFGEFTKKAGFSELANGQVREILFEDAAFSNPSRAAKADVFLFTRQTFVEFPDLRVSGPNFKDARKITDVNPQQAEYRWGRRVLFDYKNKTGVRLQGILALPEDYQPGEKRPMIVTFYEKNSQNLNRYNAPSYLTGMGASPMQAVSEGYITMLPDIHFNTGSSHSDMLDCVEAAVKKVIELGYVDPKRIAVSGHSYGGEGAAFIGTRSKLFAAVGVGAGVSDLYSDFAQSWGWSYQVTGGSGANAFDYYLYGQGRWGFSPWDNPEVYRFESAITHVKEAVPPFLIMHGTADPTVSFIEGLNFYSALRFHGKTAVLLAYPGEGHGLRNMANRKDLTIRYFEFFNHYLKGAPAPKWLTDGVSYLEKEQRRGGG